MRVRAVAVLLVLFSSLSFLSGGFWTFLHSKDKGRDVYRSLEKFAQVYKLVKQNYVEEPTDEAMVDGAIRGMLQELDPHSVYLKVEDFKQMQADTKGEFGGLGIEISKRDGKLTVVSPIEDTPAFEAGILAGDVISKIEDEPTDSLSVIDAVNRMRGKPGEPINITIQRQGVNEPIQKRIVRAVIKVKSVSHEVKDGFGVIKLRQFVERSSTELKNAISKVKKELGNETEMKGLVLDLRNNPGGLLQQAVEVADLFLEEGLIVYTQGRDEEKIAKSYAGRRGTEPSYPIVVLINGGSASASEIVAGALQDHKRAHVIGTQSFGKGSVQHVVPLDDGSGVKLTVALYYTPNGRQIQGSGITPDERVLGPFDVLEITRERDLPGHIKGENEEKAAKEAEKLKKSLEAEGKAVTTLEEARKLAEKGDPQLDRAIAYLKNQIQLAGNELSGKKP